MLAPVSDPRQDSHGRIAGEITVDEWLDVDRPSSQQPTLVPEPSERRPGLLARLIHALRGNS
jgi:hypothetical protein